ncbi:MAG: nucleotidyl transferase AbiEii/AbiGii toxin family protein [Armatimonadetes bacterium]|nr:nucleotidyl transferase AbiEii/AbiGii toxin family protein [Armatimonadota bacterium]
MNPPEHKRPQGERNPGASLQQKLRNYARSTGEDTALVLIRYLNERFLYRLACSPYRDRFVLRGATLFTIWDSEPHRATRDIDLLATGDNSPIALRKIIEAVCVQPVEEDEVVFLPDTLHIEELSEGRIYQGLHLEMGATLGTARLRLEIDIAFGEAAAPPPEEVDLPALLGKPAPRLRAYQKETVIAEKCQALVNLGMVNTRMKDFYDLWYLSSAYSFEGTRLCAALHATFTRRETAYPTEGLPFALTDSFSNDALKQRQWSAFLGKTALRKGAGDLFSVIQQIRGFLQPPLQALANGEAGFALRWSPERGWR